MKVLGKEFEIYKGHRPKVLLLGNGFNRAFGDKSWNEFLKAITDKEKFSDDPERYIMPMSLKAAMLSNGQLDQKLKKYKENVLHDTYSCSMTGLLDLFRKFVTLPFDYILTTNYSYEIELALTGKSKLSSKDITKLMNHTKGEQAEPKYFLHTFNEVPLGSETRQVWHIHGEYRKPSSMVLGQYYYGNLLCRYGQILDTHTKLYALNLRKRKPQRITSWIDAFVLGDVYIIGQGMNFAETDLWWLLERKSLQNDGISGKTVFYNPIENHDLNCAYCSGKSCNTRKDYIDEDQCRLYLLDTYDVVCKNLNFEIHDNSEYEEFYKKTAEELRTELTV